MKNQRIIVLFLMILGIGPAPLRAQSPAIASQPASRAVWTGANVTFAASASGAGPLSYQWQFNGKNLTNNIITTVAGGRVGDGGAPTRATLNGPASVAVDAAGNLFIADTATNCIRKVSIGGSTTTVAGTGAPGFSGDKGLAALAKLNQPSGVVVDSLGNLFIADGGNYRVRKVTTNGIITTVAGGGTKYPGDGGAATNADLEGLYGESVHRVIVDAFGNVLFSEAGSDIGGQVRKVSTNGTITTIAGRYAYNGIGLGDGGPATNAFLGNPQGLALDAVGNLFIADAIEGCGLNSRIRKVSTDGIIVTVAYYSDVVQGQGYNLDLSKASGVAVDASGNLFIADTGNGVIREINNYDLMTTVAGGFRNEKGYSGDGDAATNATLNSPSTVTLDASGNLFIADTGNNVIRKVINTQGPSLALSGVNAANAGNYKLVVTGPGGQTTSSAASLIVATSPLIYQVAVPAPGSVALDFVSPPGSTNVVLSTPDLSPSILWQPLSTNVAGADGGWQFIDTNAASYPARFYVSHQ